MVRKRRRHTAAYKFRSAWVLISEQRRVGLARQNAAKCVNGFDKCHYFVDNRSIRERRGAKDSLAKVRD